MGISVTVKEVALVQGIAAPTDDAARAHASYIQGHLTLKQGEVPLEGVFERVTPPSHGGDEEQRAYVYEFRYGSPHGVEVPLSISHQMLREYAYAPGQPWEVSYVLRWKRLREGEVQSYLLRSGVPLSIAFGSEFAPLSDSGRRVFSQYLDAGVWHILTGVDHLLFMGALVFGAVRFWAVVRVVAAFTLAHTVTLALAAFEWVRLPSLLIEPLIAGSIVFVGVENFLWPHRGRSRMRLGIAFGFGLVHGLGFAGGLLEAMRELPGISLWLALTAFSLGVELGHQAVVLPLFGLLRMRRGPENDAQGPGRDGLRKWASAAIAMAGLAYLVRAVMGAS